MTIVRDKKAKPASDLVDRRFDADGTNKRWVADITYAPTWAGFLFLAVVIDVWSRKVVGWAMVTHLQTEFVVAALDVAVAQRQPRNVIPHSDQGTQFTAIEFVAVLLAYEVRISMDGRGRALDIVFVERLSRSLK